MSEDFMRIKEVFIEDELKEAYLSYAMSVIIGRALPDVRDGLKPVHRRILYAMYELGLMPNKPHKKSARIVGEVIGKYHPHGDSAVYEALVRLAQDFSVRYPLIDGQGNFGSVDGDAAAAMRYTEARLTKIATEMLKDIEKETVDFVPNFDDTLKEPSVLPARIPQLIINGSSGIAVGMATNIPPHNLSEVIDSAIYLIDHPDTSSDELLSMGLIKGPDFPTGGLILYNDDLVKFYKTGQGVITIKGIAEVEENIGKGRSAVVIKEIPYLINKISLIEKIVELVKSGKIKDIVDIRDESDKRGIRVVIEVKRDGDPNVVLNQLYKFTNLKTTFPAKFLAIVDGVPKILSLRDYLINFISFRKEVIIRRTKFELKNAEEKLHILEGLKIAISHIDEVIKLIKSSKNVQEARKGLISTYELSEKQAQAILEMKLQKLTGLEMSKIIEEYENTRSLIIKLKYILDNESEQYRIIKEELIEIKEKYGDDRKSRIIDKEDNISIEDLIKDEDFVVMITDKDYIKKVPLVSYRSQKRGGKGTNAYIKESDFIKNLFIANSKDYLLIFTSDGSVHWIKTYEIPTVSGTSKGRPIVNYIDLKGHKIMSVIGAGDLQSGYLIFITKKGFIKKTEMENFSRPRSGGIKAINLEEGDRLVNVVKSEGTEDIIVESDVGYAIRFSQKNLSTLGRTARGVKAIKLREGEFVIGMELVTPGKTLLTITEKGYGKRTLISDYPVINRGGRGVIDIKTDGRNGRVVSLKSVKDDDEVLIVTKAGKIIRIKVKDIRIIGRNTKGVKIVNLEGDDYVVNVEKIEK